MMLRALCRTRRGNGAKRSDHECCMYRHVCTANPIPTDDAGAPDAELIQAITEPVLVDHRQFMLRAFGSETPFVLDSPAELLFAGSGGAMFLSAGSDHLADVRVELWSGRPPADHSASWELAEQGTIDVDVRRLVLESLAGRIGAESVMLPEPGGYAIRAYCRGREAASDAAIGDDLEFPTNLEHWLIQLWRI